MKTTSIRYSEVLAALSRALDLTEGQPAGHAVRTCLIGMRLAEALHLGGPERSALYYTLLLKDAGCSSNAAHVAALFDSDDRLLKQRMKLVNWPSYLQAAVFGARHAALGRGLRARLAQVVRLAQTGPSGARQLVHIRCERGAQIVRQLGFPEATAEAIRSLDEHWDGRGHPDGLRAHDIPLLARIACLAQTVDVFLQARGLSSVGPMLRQRRGSWFDPELVDIVRSWLDDHAWWQGLLHPEAETWVLAAEPGEFTLQVDEAGLDTIAQAFADIIDAKTPFTYRHSSGVAGYARALAQYCGLSASAQRRLHRAGLLHDIGKLGISNRILDKPGPLSVDERREIERHPVYTWEILSRVTAFSEFARMAALHHERLDGSGYPWGVNANELDLSARILAVADVYEALTARRPYRDGLSTRDALTILQKEAGPRLDQEVVKALAALAREGILAETAAAVGSDV